MKYDVVVIGSGMSGLMAAAKAVSLNKSVMVITKGQGVLPLTTGCVDFWGYRLDNPSAPAANPLAEIKKLTAIKPEHPYAKVLDVITESVDFFLNLLKSCGLSYCGSIDKNRIVLTALGTERVSALVPPSMTLQAPEKIKTIIAVGFKNYPDFFPRMFLDNLPRTSFPQAEAKIPLLIDLGINETVRSGHLSLLLEDTESLKKTAGQVSSLLSARGIALEECQDSRMLIVFPAVLGRNPDHTVWRTLSERLKAQVIEVPGLPPSIPGQRLNQALITHLRKHGTEFYYNREVTGFCSEKGRVTSLQVKDSSSSVKTVEAGSVILAGGSFMGGGLLARKKAAAEPIFNLPVVNRTPQGEGRFLSLEGQPFLEAGLEVDNQLRPTNSLQNLYAVGSILAHSNYAAEKSGLGIALATGYKAGCLA